MPERHPEAPPPGTKLRKHYAGCFGCGEDSPGGLRLKFTVGEGLRVDGQFLVHEVHQGAPGLAHGGVLTAALDETLGTLNILIATPAVTGKLDTEFRRPVPVDQTLYLSAQIDGVRGKKIFSSAEGRLGSEDGLVAVRARGLFIQVSPEHFTTHGRPAEDWQAAGGIYFNP